MAGNDESVNGYSAGVHYAISIFLGAHRKREEKNDQVDCRCWPCFSHRNIGASNDASAAYSAGPHDHASPHGLWRGQGNG
jgi:hypothetical protein